MVLAAVPGAVGPRPIMTIVVATVTERLVERRLIPLPDQSEFMMYGNDVMDLTILGLRSI